ncbi:hypothetical protein LTR17_010792 [Elasticomyces elasticus]|nr:hypothetical protein LTR17_010792 [Elasticomyces elasticus]
MLAEADDFPMLSPQDHAPAPATQAPGSREVYGGSHHAYQPHSGPTLQTGSQSGGYQSSSQGFTGIRNTEAPQPRPSAAPYGHTQPTQLPMDPQQMYHAPSIPPVTNTMAPQASVYAAPYSHRRPTQLHVDPQQTYQAPSIQPVTNYYNYGVLVQGDQYNFSGNNGMQFHAAPPGTILQPSNHTDNAAAERSRPAYQAPSVPPGTNNYNLGTRDDSNTTSSSVPSAATTSSTAESTSLPSFSLFVASTTSAASTLTASPTTSETVMTATTERSKPAGPPLKETNILQ